MNAATEVKRHKLTQEDCDIARFFTRRGMKINEIAKILKVDPSTVGKIQKADFRLTTYLEQRKEMNRKTKERKAAAGAGRQRLNELIGTQVDEERDKKIMDQLMRDAGFKQTPQGWKKAVDQELKDQGWDELQKKLPEVPGQMKMDLEGRNGGDGSPVPLTRNGENRPLVPEADEQKSMMKFQAAMMDKLLKKLDELIDVLKGGAGDE